MKSNEGVIILGAGGGGTTRTGSGMTTLEVMMHAPVLRGSQINTSVLDQHFKRDITYVAAQAPTEALHQARQRQLIDQHNAEVDAAKARKQQLRQIAKQSRVPVESLKRMIKSVRRG